MERHLIHRAVVHRQATHISTDISPSTTTLYEFEYILTSCVQVEHKLFYNDLHIRLLNLMRLITSEDMRNKLVSARQMSTDQHDKLYHLMLHAN